MKRFLVLISVLLVGFASCKKDPIIPDSTDDELARDVLYNIMKTYYLWNDKMPEVKKEDYPDPYKLLEGMRYRKLDRWSYMQDYDEFERQNNAIFVGHGIMIALDEDDRTRIAQVYNKSQIYAKGVRRGWIIKKLNDVELAPIFINNDMAAYSALIGPSQAGRKNEFLFEMPNGKDTIISDTKATFTLNTVIHYDTLHLKTGVTGHLVYEQFIKPSNAELETVFKFFSQNNINNIIVDLRYNGGGDLTVLQNLAAYIGGSSRFKTPFLTMTYNEQQKSQNRTINFSSVSSPVNIDKMIVITTRGTASASEDLINGLTPFMEIKTIGDTTNGKPVGMNGFTYPSHKPKYIFLPITFTLFNTNNESDFYDGIAPEKYVPDDITYDWGDKNEACLKEAIYLLENGSVSSKGEYKYSKPSLFSEGSRLNNAFLIE
jgi:C-terminal processing protease CtpA/Prc